MVSKHGGGPRVVVQESDQDSRFLIFDDSGLVSDGSASFDPNTNQILRAEDPAFSQFIFPYERAFAPAEVDDLADTGSLSDLAEKMKQGWVETNSEIPAAYTYLGQFIMHDLSHFSGEENALYNKRSPSLDLDSVFPSGAKGYIPLSRTSVNGELQALSEDLPRDEAGRARIPDDRNDDNLPVAQIHSVIAAFYNEVLSAGIDSDEAKRLTCQYFQSAVLHDYLNRVIDREVYKDIVQNGRAIIHPKGHPPKKAFYLCMEFAFAAGRFGHTMIREAYPLWNTYHNASPRSFWSNTFNSSEGRPFNQTPRPPDYVTSLPREWVTQWRAILDFGDGNYGIDRTEHDGPIRSALIDTQLAPSLLELPEIVVPAAVGKSSVISHSRNLAERTLLRGRLLEIPSGQQIAEEANRRLRANRGPAYEVPVLGHSDIIKDEAAGVAEVLSRERKVGETYRLSDRTPLWFYVLKEALLTNGGNRLGPLGSRIVMESIHAAIQYSRTSILNSAQQVSWKPDKAMGGKHTDHYEFTDMIRFCGLSDRPV